MSSLSYVLTADSGRYEDAISYMHPLVEGDRRWCAVGQHQNVIARSGNNSRGWRNEERVSSARKFTLSAFSLSSVCFCRSVGLFVCPWKKDFKTYGWIFVKSEKRVTDQRLLISVKFGLRLRCCSAGFLTIMRYTNSRTHSQPNRWLRKFSESSVTICCLYQQHAGKSRRSNEMVTVRKHTAKANSALYPQLYRKWVGPRTISGFAGSLLKPASSVVPFRCITALWQTPTLP